MDEGKILKSLKEQEPGAFKLLFHHFHTPMVDHVMRIVNDRMDAEDIVADVFCTFYDKAVYNGIESHLFRYLLRMCTNQSYNFIKSRSRRTARQTAYYDNPAVPVNYWQDQQNRIDEETRQAQRQLIENAINSLPPKRKEAMTMRYINDMSYQEIALHSGQNVESVRKSLFMALKHLRKLFTKKQHD